MVLDRKIKISSSYISTLVILPLLVFKSKDSSSKFLNLNKFRVI